MADSTVHISGSNKCQSANRHELVCNFCFALSGKVTVDLVQPLVHMLEGLPIANVVHEDDSVLNRSPFPFFSFNHLQN